MSVKVITDGGDGKRLELDLATLKNDIRQGSLSAAKSGKIDPLTNEDLQALTEIFLEPDRVVSVEPGSEVITTDDGAPTTIYTDNSNGGLSLPVSPGQAALIFERVVAADTACMGLADYSCRPMKPIIEFIASEYYITSQLSTAPLFYGFQPNLGLYFQPVGPFPDHFGLMKAGQMKEAMQAQEDAVKALVDDIVFVTDRLNEAGVEGINLDTSGSYGDPDMLASLLACERIKENWPDLPVELGFAGESIIGMNGRMKYQDIRLAGAYPHVQVELAAKAGASIAGLAVNTNTGMSTPWNLARAVTFVKAASQVAKIPIHVNVGMGVGGLPMDVVPSVGAVSRCSKAMVEIAKIDGL